MHTAPNKMMICHRTTVVLSAVGLMLAGVAITGCSSTGTVPKANLESDVLTQMQTVDPTTSVVTCPGDIEGKLGATITCEATFDDGANTKRAVIVEVVGVDGDKIEFSIKGKAG